MALMPDELEKMQAKGLIRENFRQDLPKNYQFFQVVYNAKITTTLKPLRRFSKLAQQHTKWHEAINKFFPVSFSDPTFVTENEACTNSGFSLDKLKN
jgi:hypothetical protein